MLSAVSIPDAYGVAILVCFLGIGGWIVRELYRTAQIIAKTSATLTGIDRRIARLEERIDGQLPGSETR